jgi:hypothetical protein
MSSKQTENSACCWGIDAVPVKRAWKEKDWTAVLGVAILPKNIVNFNTRYYQAINSVLSTNGIKQNRPVYSSYSFQTIFNDSELCFDAFESILIQMEKEIAKINFMFSDYPKMLEIKMFGEKRMSKLSPKEFIEKHLFNSYPHVCCWKVLNENKNCRILVDGFSGYLTEAWREIEKYDNIDIYVHGDECVPIISLADITLRIAMRRLEEKSLFLGRRELMKAFITWGDKLKVDYLGKQILPKVTPKTNINMPVHRKYKHPIFFAMIPKTQFINNESFICSPKGHSLFHLAHESDGCVKFFDKRDTEIVKDDDYFIYFDEEGNKSVKLLESFGFKINSLHIKQIDDLLVKKQKEKL